MNLKFKVDRKTVWPLIQSQVWFSVLLDLYLIIFKFIEYPSLFGAVYLEKMKFYYLEMILVDLSHMN